MIYCIFDPNLFLAVETEDRDILESALWSWSAHDQAYCEDKIADEDYCNLDQWLSNYPSLKVVNTESIFLNNYLPVKTKDQKWP